MVALTPVSSPAGSGVVKGTRSTARGVGAAAKIGSLTGAPAVAGPGANVKINSAAIVKLNTFVRVNICCLPSNLSFLQRKYLPAAGNLPADRQG